MNIIRVGDPHVKVTNLEESERLLGFILSEARRLKVDRIELLGDLFDTMSIVRLEVLTFWLKWLPLLAEEFETIVLVGNHDQSGNRHSENHSLSVFINTHERLFIIQSPVSFGGIGYLPYIHDNDVFTGECNKFAANNVVFIVSHTEFSGAKYDNGMYAPNGVNPDLIDDRIQFILSGHVHTEQDFGRVIYPGTARWASASDANKRKGIWLFEHDNNGRMLKREFISTESVCVPIISLEWREGDPQPTFPENAKISVELIGTSNWITQVKATLKGQVAIKTKITDTKKAENRKAGVNLEEYLRNTYVSTMNKENLIKWAKEMDLV